MNPATTEKATQEKSSILAHQWATYANNLRYEQLPDSVVQETKRRLIDSLGCAFGALDWEPAGVARNLAKLSQPTSGSRGATVIGTNHVAPVDHATFANGVLIRYLDFNDTYLSLEPAHPSDNMAATLAVAEQEQSSGKDFITASVLAYEIQCRLCDAASIRSRGWDHVTYGAFSSALAAGKLYGLSEEQLVHTLGLAGVANVAMRQTRVGELSHWKGCAFANAARNGVFAATLAKLGMSGPSHIFEGEMGFWNQVSGAFELATLGNGSSQDFMMERTYVKHFPAEYHAQSAIEAALALRSEMGDPAQYPQTVANIRIESFDAAVDIIAGFEEHWRPTQRETADHSMPYMVGAAFLDGDVTMETFTPARIQDSRLIDFIQKIKVDRSDEMNAGYPEGIPNRITVTMADGRELVKQVTYPEGHAKNPMNDAQIEAKFRKLASKHLSESQMDDLLHQLHHLETVTDLRPVLSLCSLGL